MIIKRSRVYLANENPETLFQKVVREYALIEIAVNEKSKYKIFHNK